MDIVSTIPDVLVLTAIGGIYIGAMRAWRHERRRASAVRDESGWGGIGSSFGEGGECGSGATAVPADPVAPEGY